MAAFLTSAVRSRLNILICGGTGAGKSTLLNVLSSCISNKERLVTIEDAAELQLRQDHVVRLETRPPTSMAAARSAHATSCAMRCACVPTASSWAKCAG